MDRLTPTQRSALMSRVRTRDTDLEVALRRLLHARGHRYRVQYGPRRIDVAFPGKRVAVFVDSCFWHACPLHATFPATNAEWWRAKLERNAARDARTTRELRAEGWRVLRVWEHELRASPATVVRRVERALTARSA